MNGNVIRAVFWRNFTSYFANPTGYVFICVYVVLCSLAAFWTVDFFNANLANLDQLNKFYPLILIVFTPAITMSIWAEERRQGTDELLLTLPAADVDVVMGKYLAAGAIFTASLLFSALTNTAVLSWLGSPDLGLMFGTHVGYWLLGMAMIAIGMAASFLTPNLTVSYILGALFNAPLVALAWAETWIPYPQIAHALRQWSLAERFRDFSRGVISLSATGYFLLIVAVMIYVAMVLIGRRHWLGGRDGQSLVGHYVVRCLALVAAAVGANLLLNNFDLFRVDVTREHISTLSSASRRLIRELRTAEKPKAVKIDAYISPIVPESYVQTRLNLLSALREFDVLGGGAVQVQIHSVQPFSEDAERAEQQYGITAQTVQTRTRGAFSEAEVFLGAAFVSGVEKVVVPFFDKGLPPEYEIVRSIATVSQEKRKRLGVVTTDVNLFGGFSMAGGGMTQSNEEQVITELKKQYEVLQVDPTDPIEGEYDALLAVQPSSLSPPQLDNFLAAVYSGVPTAIFEDPIPYPMLFANVPGTWEEKQPQGGMMGMQQPPEPKGQITKLWDRLGIRFSADQVAFQGYNPYPNIEMFNTPEWVFAAPGSGATEAFNRESDVSKNLQQLLFVYPGYIEKRNTCKLDYVPLVRTADSQSDTMTGVTPAQQVFTTNPFLGKMLNRDVASYRQLTGDPYTLAVRLTGALAPEEKSDDPFSKLEEMDGDSTAETKEADVDVAVVGDIDCLSTAFFDIRARGDIEGAEVDFQMDNVTFVLNLIDSLAGDDRFIAIRSRRPVHRTLTAIEDATSVARAEADRERAKFQSEFNDAVAEAEKELNEQVAKLEQGGSSPLEVQIQQERLSRQLAVKRQALQRDRDDQIREIEGELTRDVRQVQDKYKMFALLIPPVPPMLVGLFVFFNRRAREKEGVSKTRLRS